MLASDQDDAAWNDSQRAILEGAATDPGTDPETPTDPTDPETPTDPRPWSTRPTRTRSSDGPPRAARRSCPPPLCLGGGHVALQPVA